MTIPTKIILHKISRTIEIIFDEQAYIMPAAYLREKSLSAEQKHVRVKQDFSKINILAIEPVGQYGIKLIFSDGHNTGIYSWEYLATLCKNYVVHHL